MDKCQRSLQDVGFVEEKSEIIFNLILTIGHFIMKNDAIKLNAMWCNDVDVYNCNDYDNLNIRNCDNDDGLGSLYKFDRELSAADNF